MISASARARPVVLALVLGAAACAQIFGIDSATSVPAPDGGEATDASLDASMADGADSGGPLDGCAAILARALSAPIVPPNEFAGIDLTGGGQFTNVPGGGSVTLPQVGLAACAVSIEPTKLPFGTAPNNAGYRLALFGGNASAPVMSISTNMQSGTIDGFGLGQGYTGALSFHSRDGADAYEIGIGYVHKNGADFDFDWGADSGYTDGGFGSVATPKLNELYDALVATFAPDTPALTEDCTQSTYYGYYSSAIKAHWSSCVWLPGDAYNYSLFLVRPLSLLLYFDQRSSRTSAVYGFWVGGIASCATAIANTEQMDFGSIGVGQLGGILQNQYASNPLGLTAAEVNEIECNGTPTAAPDPGYGAIAWGQTGEVAMEYVLDGGVNYRLYARAGYQGSWDYGFHAAIGAPLQSGAGKDYVIDWSDAGVIASVTKLANSVCGVSDTDCVAAGDCTIAPDRNGSSYVGFPCGKTVDTLGITFPQGTSTPSEIFTTNPSFVP